MQHDVKLETHTFMGSLIIKNKQKYKIYFITIMNMGQDPKSSKKIDLSISAPPKATISCHKPKVSSAHFEDSYYHINPIENTNNDTRIIYAHNNHSI